MTEISLWLLTLSDGRIIFQRRGNEAPISPGKLGFFGGHVDAGETFEEAANRELEEETSLKVNELIKKHLADYKLSAAQTGRGDMLFHLYLATIDNAEFEIYEGDRVEVYSRDEALRRQDLTPSVIHVLTNIWKG